MSFRLTGLTAAPFTPMHPDQSLDYDQIPEYARFLVRNGVSGAFVNGSTGEGLSLTFEERLRTAERWVAAAPPELAVAIHVGDQSLAVSKELTAHARRIGARAVGCLPPFYRKPASVAALADYLAEIAAAAPDLPFYYYHIPVLTHVEFPIYDLLLAVKDRVPNFAGAKFTFENLFDFGRCCDLDHGRFDMLFGRDEIFLAGLTHGATGFIGTTYSFTAPLYLQVWAAFRAGNLPEAMRLQSKVRDLVATMIKFGGWKALMGVIGMECGPTRPPLPNPSAATMKAMVDELRQGGFFECCNR